MDEDFSSKKFGHKISQNIINCTVLIVIYVQSVVIIGARKPFEVTNVYKLFL